MKFHYLLLACLCSCASGEINNTPKNSAATTDTAQTDSLSQATDPEEELRSPDTVFVDKAYVGMSLNKLRAAYKGQSLIKEPAGNYGIDGGGNGWLLSIDKEPRFFVWATDDNDTIAGIVIVSEKIKIDGDVHVGMSLQDYLNRYNQTQMAIDQITYFELAYVKNLKYSLEFHTTDTNRVAEYEDTEFEPIFKKFKKLNAKVDRISVN